MSHRLRSLPLDMRQLAKSMAQIAMDGGLNGTTPFELGCCAGALVSGQLLHKDGDRLGGHIDDVENDMSQPIVSVGLGCGAIILVGGTTRDEEPHALRLRNGDAVTRWCCEALLPSHSSSRAPSHRQGGRR
jgi:alkylated DNA repair protein alkB family protein 1